MKWSRTFEVISCQLQLYPSNHALKARHGGAWTSYSSEDLREAVDQYSTMLWHLGVRKGDRVLMIPNLVTDRWLFLDLGIQQLGAIAVPFHASSQATHFQLIAEETAANLCFFPDPASQTHFLPEDALASGLRPIYLDKATDEASSLSVLLSQNKQKEKPDLDAVKEAVVETDLASIIYTSGTTGRPKGVMLSHANIVSNIKSALPLLPLQPGKTALSFLPFSHVFERTTVYAYLASGTTLCLAEDRDFLLEAFKEVKPHYFTTVPRILERMYDRVLEFRAKQPWWMKKTISWALNLGENYNEQAKVRPMYWLQKHWARLLVFNRFRRISGGKVEAIFTGAAYLRPELGRIFGAAGIKVREGYGMTECSPIITMNQYHPGMNRYGTVGLPIPGVQVKIDAPDENNEGEILVQGPNVMQGYYKQPEETAKVLSADGWLRTGDIGKFVHRRFLQITDRKKDIFKTSSGKYVAPMMVENHLCHSPYIQQAMVIGFKREYAAALIMPNFSLMELWCIDHGIHWTSPAYMIHNIKFIQKIQQEVDRINEGLATHEKVRAFHLFEEEWTIENGHLTYTMKLVRNKIVEDFGKAIEAMYGR